MKKNSNNLVYHLIYPHQLFKSLFSFPKYTCFLIIEDPLFFGDKKYHFRFHKQKLVFHRASMQALKAQLLKSGYSVKYFDYSKNPTPEFLIKYLKIKKTDCVSYFDPNDYILEKRLVSALKQINSVVYESPNFLTSKEVIKDFFKEKKHYSMSSFYAFQRKRLSILIDKNGRPVGGKWSFDKENRKKLPKNIKLPKEIKYKENSYVKEAKKYVEKNFPTNPGNIKNFNYPITHKESNKALVYFINKKLDNFGAFEDAIAKDQLLLFHSGLSAPLNVGLLSPIDVVKNILKKKKSAPLASIEGFIRQVVGWREFMRAVYVLKGSTIRNMNTLRHEKKLSVSWYKGTTGLAPVDNTIHKLLDNAYLHHIERLMVIGNMMLLCQIKPNDVYRWFMELFIDAYDWVMVPNVYSMSQYADGGLITTKPYFSSSNYILKMSDFKKGSWCDIWDSLFYLFILKNKKLILKNPRLSLLMKHANVLSKADISKMKKIAKKYI